MITEGTVPGWVGEWLARCGLAAAAGGLVGAEVSVERTAKWNRLLHIEETLGDVAAYRGWSAIRPAASRP